MTARSIARRCGKCGGRAHLAQEYGDLPLGTTYTFQCGSCRREFDVLSTWRVIVWSGYIAFFGWLLTTKIGHNSPRDRFILIAIGAGFVLLFGYQLTRSVLNARTNPRLESFEHQA